MNPAAQNNLASGGDNCGVWNNSNFGNPFVTTRVNPDVQHGWGVRQLRLAVRRRRAARDPPAGRARRQLQPPLVGEPLLHRQPRAGAAGFRSGHDHGAAESESAGRRRLPGDVPDAQRANGARCDRQLLHVRERLRRRDDLLARRGRAGERAAVESAVRAARLERRPRRARLLRRGGEASGAVHDGRVAPRQSAGGIVRDQRGLADEHPRPGVVHRAQDRRPGERLVPLDTGCGASRGRRREQRQLAVGELQRLERDSAAADRASAGAGPDVPDGQPPASRGTRFPIRSIRSTSASART